MKNAFIGVISTLLVVFIYRSCSENKQEETIIKQHSALIQKQLKNVGKLIVTEGHFSQVYNYKNSKAVFGNLINTEKKALVVINADVTIAYNLSEIVYHLDEEQKTVTITKIPKEEVEINPDFEYYDVQAGFLNPFKAEDYNQLKKEAKKAILKKINKSDLRKNAKNRLISELSKFYILTNSLGWTLNYNETTINDKNIINNLKL